jgi:hypothetical protein
LKAFSLRVAAMAAAILVAMSLAAPTALAHETRRVGPYEFTVGWGDEPTYTGFKNSVQLLLADAGSGEPVNELGGTVEAEVIFGDASTTLEMEPSFLPGVFGEEGDYRAWVIPTRSGEFSYRFTGSINGTDIDETFTCGDETFDCPVDSGEIEFPERDPSRAELAGRLEQEVPRLTADASAASDDASSAQTLSYVGIGLGGLGLLVALAALLRGRGRT